MARVHEAETDPNFAACLAALGEHQTSPEFPSHERFLERLRRVGFCSVCMEEDEPRPGKPRPTAPVRLYRGCLPEFAFGPFWTPSRREAERYAAIQLLENLRCSRNDDGPGSGWPIVAAATIPPAAVLAINTFSCLEEFVVDPLRLAAVDTIPLTKLRLAAVLPSSVLPAAFRTGIAPATLLELFRERAPELYRTARGVNSQHRHDPNQQEMGIVVGEASSEEGERRDG